jgi:hypothetical protein
MSGAGCVGHAQSGLSDASILVLGCNDKGPSARGKKSTVSVDNIAEKFSGAQNFSCFSPRATVCLIFRQTFKALILMQRISRIRQTPDKSQEFVTDP